MSKKSKLIDRFLSIPADFTWDELTKVLSSYGYYEIKTGKTGGSRRRFVDDKKKIKLKNKPQPENIKKKSTLKQDIEKLE